MFLGSERYQMADNENSNKARISSDFSNYEYSQGAEIEEGGFISKDSRFLAGDGPLESGLTHLANPEPLENIKIVGRDEPLENIKVVEKDKPLENIKVVEKDKPLENIKVIEKDKPLENTKTFEKGEPLEKIKTFEKDETLKSFNTARKAKPSRSIETFRKAESTGSSPEVFDETLKPTGAPGEYAGFWVRTFAYLIDCLFLGLISTPIFAASILIFFESAVVNIGSIYRTELFEDPYALLYSPLLSLGYSVLLAYVLLPFIYFSSLESSHLRATIGKRVLSLEVTDLAGEKISFPRAIGRNFAKYFSIGFFVSGFTGFMLTIPLLKEGKEPFLFGSEAVSVALFILMMLPLVLICFNKNKRSFHDFLGSTQVLEKSPR